VGIACSGDQCNTTCSGARSCKGGISTYANINIVTCSGKNSCQQKVVCSGSSCQISCAQSSCASGKSCSAASCT
jgi:hypothetical protein